MKKIAWKSVYPFGSYDATGRHTQRDVYVKLITLFSLKKLILAIK